LAKKPNYNFQKDMKAQKRAKKQEEKRLAKIEANRAQREADAAREEPEREEGGG
jgi:hypothetical protein